MSDLVVGLASSELIITPTINARSTLYPRVLGGILVEAWSGPYRESPLAIAVRAAPQEWAVAFATVVAVDNAEALLAAYDPADITWLDVLTDAEIIYSIESHWDMVALASGRPI